jgi:hypothetical protein
MELWLQLQRGIARFSLLGGLLVCLLPISESWQKWLTIPAGLLCCLVVDVGFNVFNAVMVRYNKVYAREYLKETLSLKMDPVSSGVLGGHFDGK